MPVLISLLIIGLLIGAYLTRGWNRIMLILLAVAIIQLKSVALGMKIFSATLMVIAIVYFLKPRKKKS